jgi:hypothetical protein
MCLLSAGAFRKQVLSLSLWENKDGAAGVLSAALMAKRALLREGAIETWTQNFGYIRRGSIYLDD